MSVARDPSAATDNTAEEDDDDLDALLDKYEQQAAADVAKVKAEAAAGRGGAPPKRQKLSAADQREQALSQPIGADTADYLARWHEMNAVVFEIVLRMGGSISAEHGIGVLKRDELPDVKDKTAIELMRAIKAMLDPHGIMNPGKVL